MSSFACRDETLLVASQTRYLIKYRHSDGHLVLKVTDDKVVCADFIDFLRMHCVTSVALSLKNSFFLCSA